MDDENVFLAIASMIRQRSGLDILGYKRSCMFRRLAARCRARGCGSLEEYRDQLLADSAELTRLISELTINVTRFFRNPEMFAGLEQQVLPRLIGWKVERGERTLRVWSVGCASGEEPYSTAICVLRALGEEAPKMRILIHATDVDLDELRIARKGYYEPSALEGVDSGTIERFFVRTGDGFVIAPAVRQVVYFRRHDLMKDAAFRRLDLIMCRNILIYFTSEMQQEVLRSFHSSLNARGVLVLGKSEALVGDTRDLYVTINMQHKMFARRSAPHGRP